MTVSIKYLKRAQKKKNTSLEQIAFQWGTIRNNSYQLTLPIFSLSFLGLGIGSVIEFVKTSSTATIAMLPICAVMGYQMITHSRLAYKSNAEFEIQKKICAWYDLPFEMAKKIVIKDKKGLDMLLKKTNEKENKEWGTVLEARTENETTYIERIIPPAQAVEEVVVGNFGKDMVWFDLTTIEGKYQGTHHYRRSTNSAFSGKHFAVGKMDREGLPNTIHLLTFNRQNGPEIIGFNTQHTYIPESKDKDVLVKATKADILEYLKQ